MMILALRELVRRSVRPNHLSWLCGGERPGTAEIAVSHSLDAHAQGLPWAEGALVFEHPTGTGLF